MNNLYGFLPTIVRHDKRVKDFQCRLYSELASLSNKYGYCYATNEYLGEVFEKSPAHISRAISEMQKLGYLSVVIEDGYKRKIYVKTDFRELEEVDKNIKGDKQKYQGGLIKISRGVDKNINLEDNNQSIINKDDKLKEPQTKIEETEILTTVHDQVGETVVKVVEVISSKAKSPKYIYPPTQEELIPLFFTKLQEKKRDHPQIIDCWNWANMEAEKFFLHWERKGWTIQRLPNAIATWVNGSITFGTVTKPCPIQYKNNPANAPQPEQPKPVQPQITKQDIEARKAMFAAAKAELN
jgi:hypothetical protein